MKFNYEFSNLCGTVYKHGNLVFSSDGNSVLAPVGNRVTVFDLVHHSSFTLPFENRKDVTRIVISPNGNILMTVDGDGGCLLINFPKRILLSHFMFKKEVKDVKFSPDSKFIAVTFGRQVQIWKAPSLICEFAAFTLIDTIAGHSNDVVFLQWVNSYYLLSTSKDNTCRLTCLSRTLGYKPFGLGGHKDTVMGCFFTSEDMRLFTVSADGALFIWHWIEFTDERKVDRESPSYDAERDLFTGGQYKLERKIFFTQDYTRVSCCSFHGGKLPLLVVGFSSGVFEIFSLPDATSLHSLTVSKYSIDTVAINSSGEWLAFGSSMLGQLLVWEWQSETYVIKQQGHFHAINSVSYSPDGQLIVTGGDDGKVKLWNASNGFCFITFSDHTAPVTSVVFCNSGNAVISASLDGTVRAFDLIRYRNFKILSGPSLLPFTAVAVDSSNEIVCAGTRDNFQICVWQLQTGKLLDMLAGHEGPIAGLAFSPSAHMIASCSWDNQVKVWDLNRGVHENLTHTSMVTTVSYRSDGKELCAASLNGQLHFWDIENSELKFTIEGKEDIRGGRRMDEFRTADNSTSNCTFTSVCYSADGTCLIACGNSKYVCIYELSSRLLLKRFCLSKNQSLDGIQEKLNSRFQIENGMDVNLLDLDDNDDDRQRYMEKFDILPGVQKGDFSSRKTKQAIHSKCVSFSPNGHYWCAASTEGLVIYSLDRAMTFDPMDLELDITPKTIRKTLLARQFGKALVMSLRLGEVDLTIQMIESIPISEVVLVIKSLSPVYFDPLLNLLGVQVAKTPHLEFYLLWIKQMFFIHGEFLQNHRNQYATVFRAIQNAVSKQYTDLSKMYDYFIN